MTSSTTVPPSAKWPMYFLLSLPTNEPTAPSVTTMATTVEVRISVSFQYLMKLMTNAATKVEMAVKVNPTFSETFLDKIGICCDACSNLTGTESIEESDVLPENSGQELLSYL